jgi:hypothetical protein
VPRDEPAIFEFATASGRIDPPRGLTPPRLQIMVTCRATEPGLFRSRFRFSVEKGKSVELDVEVEVTLNEHEDFVHTTERAPEDLVFRTASLL